MSRLRAPIALRMPISRVRSRTETSMMFMIPMPPTTSEIEAIAGQQDGEQACTPTRPCSRSWAWSAIAEVVRAARRDVVAALERGGDRGLDRCHLAGRRDADPDRADARCSPTK